MLLHARTFTLRDYHMESSHGDRGNEQGLMVSPSTVISMSYSVLRSATGDFCLSLRFSKQRSAKEQHPCNGLNCVQGKPASAAKICTQLSVLQATEFARMFEVHFWPKAEARQSMEVRIEYF